MMASRYFEYFMMGSFDWLLTPVRVIAHRRPDLISFW
jgi:hypothetical protein